MAPSGREGSDWELVDTDSPVKMAVIWRWLPVMKFAIALPLLLLKAF